jgi:metallophosphoesterase superfamily enzyme
LAAIGCCWQHNNKKSMTFNDNHFQVISDVHLEFYSMNSCVGAKLSAPDPPVLSRTLCLLGDIGLPAGKECDANDYRDYLLKQASRFENVIVLTGNHEYCEFFYIVL